MDYFRRYVTSGRIGGVCRVIRICPQSNGADEGRDAFVARGKEAQLALDGPEAIIAIIHLRTRKKTLNSVQLFGCACPIL